MAELDTSLKCPYCQHSAPNIKDYYTHLDLNHNAELKRLIDSAYGD